MVLENLFDWMFSPILKLGEAWAVIVISLLITAVTTFFYKIFTNQETMKELKAELKHLQKQMKELKEDPQKFMEVQKKAMQKNMEYMKHSMKPTLITMVPLLLIFGWLRTTFTESGDLITWSFSVPLFGTGIGWLGIYILSAIFFSMTLRKLLKIH
tara:strand:- start:748 stop:1215 length:468 start_codon:yes stop_codon:yes gene_type:complete